MKRKKITCVVINIIFGLLFFNKSIYAQDTVSVVFSFQEFLGIVKKYHPMVKQANLVLSEAEAKLMKARGYFDPKLTSHFYQKQFHQKKYATLFNGSFKVPLWYGIELKASYDNNRGDYLNPEHFVPEEGLGSIGISVPVGQGLWINKRMTEVKKGKLYVQMSKSKKTLAVAQTIFEASSAYMKWKEQFDKIKLYHIFYQNALQRHNWVKKMIVFGTQSAIDSTESGINLKMRKLELEQAKLKLTKSRFNLSGYLWTDNNIPIQLTDKMIPKNHMISSVLEFYQIHSLSREDNINRHPKIDILKTKIEIKDLDRKLKANNLLPKLYINYNYLSEPNYFNKINWDDYKIGASLSFPLFLRKERAEVKLAEIKLQEAKNNIVVQKRLLENKIKKKYAVLKSLKKQLAINSLLINDFEKMFKAESQLLKLGESSIFYINMRENKLIKAKLKKINLENNFLIAIAELQRILANLN